LTHGHRFNSILNLLCKTHSKLRRAPHTGASCPIFFYENLLGLINLIMQARDSFLSLLSVGGTLLVS